MSKETHTIEILDNDHIKLMGVKYYSESYLKEMMNREYSKGLRKGQTVHVAEIRLINEREEV